MWIWICYLYIFVYYFAYCFPPVSGKIFPFWLPIWSPHLVFFDSWGFLGSGFFRGAMPCHALKKLQVYTLHTFCNLVWISWHFHRNYKHTLYIQPNFFICIPQAVHAFINLRMSTCFKAKVFLVSAFLSIFPQNWEGDNVCLLRTRQYVPGI